MANPFGIEQFDAGAALGIYQNAQDRRVQQMLLQRKLQMEDRELQRQETLSSIYRNIRDPGQPAKGGDPTAPAGGLSAPYSPPPASAPTNILPQSYAAPANGRAFDPGMPTGSPLSPAQFDRPTPAGAVTTPIAPTQPTAQPAPLSLSDHTWLSENADAINQLMGLDPEKGMALYTRLKGMDDEQRRSLQDAQDTLYTTGAAIKPLPYDQRRMWLQQHATQLQAAHPGLTAEMIAGFDPTDQNIDIAMREALGVKGMLDQQDKADSRAETARHNRATESTAAGQLGVAQGNLAVHQGALGLARGREGRIAKGGVGGSDVGGLSTADLIRMAGGN